MQTIDLQRRIDRLVKSAPSVLAFLGVRGSTEQHIEEWRHRMGGVFHTRLGHNFKRDDGKWLWEPTSDWAHDANLITNQGLDNILDVYLSGGSQIGAANWVVMASKSNTTPLATHTYAVPGFTEITGSDVSETVREAWTDGGVSSQSVDNSAAVATYTAAGAVTIYGAALAGAPSAAPTTFGDTAASGAIMYASSLFAASKTLAASDTLDITYTLTSASA